MENHGTRPINRNRCGINKPNPERNIQVEADVAQWKGRGEQVVLTESTKAQFQFISNVRQYVDFVYKATTHHGNAKDNKSMKFLDRRIPLLGPRFTPPPPSLSVKRSISAVTPLDYYIRPVSIAHPFYYPNLACPGCRLNSRNSEKLQWKSWTGAGPRLVHGLYEDEMAFGLKLYCSTCAKHGLGNGPSNDSDEGRGYCSLTNARFWKGIPPSLIPRRPAILTEPNMCLTICICRGNTPFLNPKCCYVRTV